MNITPEMKEKLVLESMLTAAVVNGMGLNWDDDLGLYTYPDYPSSFLGWDEMEMIVFDPFDYDGDRIDAVVFFGDGTIEFHFEESQEAVNWAEFPNDVIRKVINLIPTGEHLV